MGIPYSSASFEKLYTYTGSDLGARWTEYSTAFRLWAPEADGAAVALYESGDAEKSDLIHRIPMIPGENGTWTALAEGNLNGVYYTYFVCRSGTERECVDPYAKAAGLNGRRGMIVNLRETDPDGWNWDRNPHTSSSPTDCTIYEVHLRDISMSPDSGITHRGKYLGLAESGTISPEGYSTGLDHIRQLGVTHIHLMPVYDFGSVDERTADMYNWGYDPVNYNVPEGSYSTNPGDGAVRIRELKTLIQKLHASGLSVILDVVYNHVYRADSFSMNQIVPGYFVRQTRSGKLSNASGCGNDTATERSMVRKYIVDSLCYWADEYHVNGFRFDLAGLLDLDLIQDVIAAVHSSHPDILLYGEGWDMPTHATKPNTEFAIQRNAARIPEFSFFNDTMRDTMRGSVFDSSKTGFASGQIIPHRQLYDCFCGRTEWTDDPKQLVNYISCHDNHTLHDRILLSLPDIPENETARRCRLAAAFNILSMGIPFLQAGEEILRSKKNTAGGFVENSYRSPDSVNAIRYAEIADRDCMETFLYYRGLLELRKEHALFRLNNALDIRRCVSLLPTDAPEITAFMLADSTETLLVVFHNGRSECRFSLPEGSWSILVRGNQTAAVPLEKAAGSTVIPPISAAVFCRRAQNA